MTINRKQLRRDVDGFRGRFFYDAERGDIGYIAKDCDEGQCDCERKVNADGDQDCSISIADDLEDQVAEPMVRMLNAVGPLLDEVENNTCHRHADQEHGAEAEELRAGIEQALKNTKDVEPIDASAVLEGLRKSLLFLLDRIDARDSLAYLEARDEKLAAVMKERDELLARLNTPHTANFVEAVSNEAAHQVARWGVEHDAGKAPPDWFWLIGYLAGKALQAAKAEALPRYRHRKRGTTYEVLSVGEDENRRGTNVVIYRGEDDGKIWSRPSDQFFDGRFEELSPKPNEKLLHHIITVAAVCANWYANVTGADTRMRPGIAPPEPSCAGCGFTREGCVQAVGCDFGEVPR